MPNDKLKKLHSILRERGIDSKSYEDFETNFSGNADKQKKLHDVLVNRGIDNAEFEKFQSNFFGAPVSEKKNPVDSGKDASRLSGGSSPASAPTAEGDFNIEEFKFTPQKQGLGEGRDAFFDRVGKEQKANQKLVDEKSSLKRIREKRKGNYENSVDFDAKSPDAYVVEQNKTLSPLESGLIEEDKGTPKQYSHALNLIQEDITLGYKGVSELERQLQEKHGKDVFNEYESMMTDYSDLIEQFETYKEKGLVDDANGLVPSIQDYQSKIKNIQDDPLFKEYEGVNEMISNNYKKFEELKKDENFASVRELIEMKKSMQEYADKNEDGYVDGAKSIVMNSFIKMASMAGRTMDLVEKKTSGDESYDNWDRVEDFLIDLEGDVKSLYPTPTQYGRQIYTKTAKWGDYEVDFSGEEIASVRDKDGRVVDDIELTEEDKTEIKGLRKEEQTNFKGMLYQTGQVVADLGVQVALTRGMAGKNPGKFRAYASTTAVGAGTMFNGLYNDGIKIYAGDRQRAANYALTAGLAAGVATNFLGIEGRLATGHNNVIRAFFKNKNSASRAIGKRSKSQAFRDAISGRVISGAGEFFDEMVIEKGIQYGTQYLFNPENPKELVKNKEDFISEAVMSMTVGILFGGSKSPFSKDALLEATQNPDLFEKQLKVANIPDVDVDREVRRIKNLSDKMAVIPEGKRDSEVLEMIDKREKIQSRVDAAKKQSMKPIEVEMQKRLDAIDAKISKKLGYEIEPDKVDKTEVKKEVAKKKIVAKIEPKKKVEIATAVKEKKSEIDKAIETVEAEVKKEAKKEEIKSEIKSQETKLSSAGIEKEISERGAENIIVDEGMNSDLRGRIAQELLSPSIDPGSFINSADKNMINSDGRKGIGRHYLKKGGAKMDVVAQGIAEELGLDAVDVERAMVDFMGEYPDGAKDYVRDFLETKNESQRAALKDAKDNIEEDLADISETTIEFPKEFDNPAMDRLKAKYKTKEEVLDAFDGNKIISDPDIEKLKSDSPKMYAELEKMSALRESDIEEGRAIEAEEAAGGNLSDAEVKARYQNRRKPTPGDKKKVKAVVKKIQKAFPGVKVEFGDTSNPPDGARKMGQLGYLHKGVVHISNEASVETPIHEFGHLWVQTLKSKRPQAFESVAKELRGRELYNEIKSDPAYANLNDSEIVEEAMAQLIGEKGYEMENSKLKGVKRLWNMVKKAMAAIGIDTRQMNIAEMTVDKVVNQAASEILGEIRLTDASSIDFDRALNNKVDLTISNSIIEAEGGRWKRYVAPMFKEYFKTGRGLSIAFRNKIEIGLDRQKAIINGVKNNLDSLKKKTGKDEDAWRLIGDVFENNRPLTDVPEEYRTEVENMLRSRNMFQKKIIDNLIENGEVVLNAELNLLLEKNYKAEKEFEKIENGLNESYENRKKGYDDLTDSEIESEAVKLLEKKSEINSTKSKLRLIEVKSELKLLTDRNQDLSARENSLKKELEKMEWLLENAEPGTGKVKKTKEQKKLDKAVKNQIKEFEEKIGKLESPEITLSEMEMLEKMSQVLEDIKDIKGDKPTTVKGLKDLNDKVRAADIRLAESKMSMNETTQIRYSENEGNFDVKLYQRDGSIVEAEVDKKDAVRLLGENVVRNMQGDGYVPVRIPQMFLNNALYESIRANDGYVNRSYMMHDFKDFYKKIERYIGTEKLNKAKKFIRERYSDGRLSGISREKLEDGSTEYTLTNIYGIEKKVKVSDVKAFMGSIGVKPVEQKAFEKHPDGETFNFSSTMGKNVNHAVKFELSETQVMNAINEIVSTDINRVPGNVKSGKLKVDLGSLKARKNITKEIRDLMGEYTDPHISIYRTLVKGSLLAEQTKMNMDIIKSGMGSFIMKGNKGGKPPTTEHTMPVTKQDMPHLSDGETLWFTPEVHQELFGVDNFNTNWFFKGAMMMSGLAKMSLTVLTPASQDRNFLGATINLFRTGNIMAMTPQRMTDALNIVQHDYTATQKAGTIMSTFMTMLMGASTVRETKDVAAKYKEVTEAGLLGTSAEIGELQSAIDSLDGVAVLKRQKVKKAIGDSAKVFAKPYQATDAVFKVAQYFKEKERLLSRGWSEADARKEAAEMTKNTQPTYSRAPKFYRNLSKFPVIGNFILFRVEMLRTGWEIPKQAKKEWDRGDRGLAVKRMLSLSASVSAGVALTWVSKAMLGISDEEEESIREGLPSYDKNAQYIFLNKNFKEMRYINTSYVLPDSDVSKVLNAIARGKGVSGKVMDAGVEFGGGFVGMDIFMKGLEEALDNENQYGSEIANKTHDYASFYRLNHALNTLYPGILKEAYRIYNPSKMEQELFGNPRWNNVINSLLGIKMKVRKMDVTYGYVMRDQVDLIDEARKLNNYPGRGFDADKEMATRKMNEHFEKLLYQYEQGQVLFDKKEIDTQLKKRSAGKMIKDLRKGEITNYNFK